MIRGIGDPLVAIYARCYLCRIGVSLNVNKLDFFKENFYEFLLVHDQVFLFSPRIRSRFLNE